MSKRATIRRLAALALTATSGCAFFTELTSAGGADASAFTVNMEKYEVHGIDLAFADAGELWCPGQSGAFKVLAQAVDKNKPGEALTLETVAPTAEAKEARGKMDLTEFALAARGGSVEHGVFRASDDSFATLLGFDVKATYRLDSTKEVVRHFEPEYSCINAVGAAGSTGAQGQDGAWGEDGGGAGGQGGPGGAGGAGPRLMAHVTIVRTPKYEKAGLIRVTGDREAMTLFDLAKGITVVARGGEGGRGGVGGQGGAGSDPRGAGGAGGNGGEGGPGGAGGEVLLIVDDRYPELARIVGIDVAGGPPGGGGDGGYGGAGGPPPSVCSKCETPPPGEDGPGGTGGRDGSVSGRAGRSEVRAEDVSRVFTSLPPGLRLRSEARVMGPPPGPPGPPVKPPKRRR
ncbi:hypothetical protein [Nannocystis sp. SCPEA4]|uniref:hypothetical protein n=1 Tax=Nannocystis sp. SCPEA4 TaxID=2996787 RepID=UPI00226F2874|nr:hypothetical protein [Nannocystis sp. SCPEA4]MCY1058627.1 hypothetical protein [Nannocystis sp. SCPEA4]